MNYKLCIIGGGEGLATDGRDYYAKKLGVIRYHKELAQHFTRTFYFTSCFKEADFDYLKKYYRYKLDTDKIELFPNPGIKSCALTKGMSLIRDCKNLFKVLDEKTVTLLFVPGIYGFSKTLPISRKKCVFCAYFGSDSEKIASVTYKSDTTLGWLKTCFFRRAEQRILDKSDIVFVRDGEIGKKYPQYKHKIHKSGPMTAFSKADLFERTDTCQGKEIKLLYVGTLSKQKGIEYLLQAFADIAVQNSNFKLTVVGEGSRRKKLIELAEQLGIGKKVCFAGYVSDINDLFGFYKSSDMFVLPTLSEGFPRVLVEAMGHSLPVITTNVGGIPQVMKNKYNALLVQPQNTSQLRTAILEIASDSKLRKILIKNGLDSAKEEVSESAAEQHIRIIRDYINNKG